MFATLHFFALPTQTQLIVHSVHILSINFFCFSSIYWLLYDVETTLFFIPFLYFFSCANVAFVEFQVFRCSFYFCSFSIISKRQARTRSKNEVQSSNNNSCQHSNRNSWSENVTKNLKENLRKKKRTLICARMHFIFVQNRISGQTEHCN